MQSYKVTLAGFFPSASNLLLKACVARLQIMQLIRERKHKSGLENAVVGLFQKKKIGDKELTLLHSNVRHILNTKTGSFLFEWYQNKPLKKGMIIIRENIWHNQGKKILKELEDEWTYFFTEILPMIQAIFYAVRKSGTTIRLATQAAFRDIIVVKLNILGALELDVKFKVTSGLKHMFLVLQNLHDTYPPNEQQLQLEAIVARVIIPYLGFYGYYEGGSEPLVESSEPMIASQRRASTEAHKIRPLSVQTTQLETLEDIFKNAVARTNSMSEV